jgi:O-antigen/teichoic acid export membrane protein
MVYLDRFLVSSYVGLQAVTYYATPVDVLTRLLVIPNALVGALFPLVTEQWFGGDTRLDLTYRRSVALLAVLMVPIAVACVLLAHPALRLWMGVEFADRSTAVFRMLTFGMLANALAAVPYALIQAIGRPDVTAKLHIAEAVPYLVALPLVVRACGVKGAAGLWALRLVGDALILFWMWHRLHGRRTECRS